MLNVDCRMQDAGRPKTRGAGEGAVAQRETHTVEPSGSVIPAKAGTQCL
jgi:hypothetical protein